MALIQVLQWSPLTFSYSTVYEADFCVRNFQVCQNHTDQYNIGVLLHILLYAEFFWETMAKREWTTTDDQNSINLVLDSLNINWVDFKKGKEDIEKRKYDIFGLVRLSKPKFKMFVSLLSFERVCRRTCEPERRSDYFVWHALAIAENRTVANKMNQALLGRAWFLSERWEELTMTQPTLQQEEWLKFVMSKSTCEWTGTCD